MRTVENSQIPPVHVLVRTLNPMFSLSYTLQIHLLINQRSRNYLLYLNGLLFFETFHNDMYLLWINPRINHFGILTIYYTCEVLFFRGKTRRNKIITCFLSSLN